MHTHTHTCTHMHTHAHTRTRAHAHMHTHAHTQVLDLLESIGMKQYTAKFREELINGEVLAELDEEMMMGDLGISSKLHRMRLMKVWKGGEGEGGMEEAGREGGREGEEGGGGGEG